MPPARMAARCASVVCGHSGSSLAGTLSSRPSGSMTMHGDDCTPLPASTGRSSIARTVPELEACTAADGPDAAAVATS